MRLLIEKPHRLQNKTTGKPSNKLRMLREIADDIGVTVRKLVGAMNSDKNHPKPIIERGVSGKNAYYDSVEFKKWWDGMRHDR